MYIYKYGLLLCFHSGGGLVCTKIPIQGIPPLKIKLYIFFKQQTAAALIFLIFLSSISDATSRRRSFHYATDGDEDEDRNETKRWYLRKTSKREEGRRARGQQWHKCLFPSLPLPLLPPPLIIYLILWILSLQIGGNAHLRRRCVWPRTRFALAPLFTLCYYFYRVANTRDEMAWDVAAKTMYLFSGRRVAFIIICTYVRCFFFRLGYVHRMWGSSSVMAWRPYRGSRCTSQRKYPVDVRKMMEKRSMRSIRYHSTGEIWIENVREIL